MIQRHLLRQSRAIAPRWQALSRASSSLTQFAPRRIPSSALRWREASKCYSTTHAADAHPEAETTQPEQVQPASGEESPLSKELEAKDREIIDLKVNKHPSLSLSLSQTCARPPLFPKAKKGNHADREDKSSSSVINVGDNAG